MSNKEPAKPNLTIMNILNTISTLNKVVQDLQNCLIKNCKNEQENMMKNKDTICVKKLFQDFITHKISMEEFIKKGIELNKNLLKSKENKAIIKCQLNKCHDETKHGINVSIDKILEFAPKDSMGYKFAIYYNKNMRNKKLTEAMIKTIHIKMKEVNAEMQKKLQEIKTNKQKKKV